MKKHIFVLGLDPLNESILEQLPHADDCEFHQLLTIEELQGEEIPIADLLERATAELERFEGSVDAVVGYWDFPVSSMVPILCERFGLRGPSLEAVAKCEHKYWSRLEQRKAIDEHPAFALVDPYADDVQPPRELDFPFWLKPVKSFSADLAFHVTDGASFDEAITQLRAGMGRVSEPFSWVLEQLELPPELAELHGSACVAEAEATGDQVTVEGFALDGEVVVYGVVDSISYPHLPTFQRYQYPSRLPADVLARMADVSQRVIRHIGLDAHTFNIEYFWDETHDRLCLLEINPRHSQSHAPLFAHVDGLSNHACMVDLALGRRPDLPQGKGPFGVAAKWYLKRFTDGVVSRVPTPAEIADLEERVSGLTVTVLVEEGDRLADQVDNDSYSFKLANLFLGAADEHELLTKYQRCVEALPFEFDDVD